jgi:hypothetical protein
MNIPRDPIKYPAEFSDFVEIVEDGIDARFGTRPDRINEACGDPVTSLLLRVDKTDHDSDPFNAL